MYRFKRHRGLDSGVAFVFQYNGANTIDLKPYAKEYCPMYKKQGSKIGSLLIVFLMTFLLFPQVIRADMGPKPSVVVYLKNLGDQTCYATLLSEKESTGPYSTWDGQAKNARYKENPYNEYDYLEYGKDIWQAFVDYADQDPDHFYFLQTAWRVDESKELAWTYYPPKTFKVLLYFPETQTYAVSGINFSYAFDSYFKTDVSQANLSLKPGNKADGAELLLLNQSYNYKKEIASLLIRIVLTVLVEMLIALLFTFREKKQLLLILGVNVGTQIILNVLLNIINYRQGPLAFYIFYILLELVVIVIEAVLFYIYIPKVSNKAKAKWLPVLYAIVGNAASYAAGNLLASYLPTIF